MSTFLTAPTVTELESGTFALPTLASGDTYQLSVTANVTATNGAVTPLIGDLLVAARRRIVRIVGAA